MRTWLYTMAMVSVIGIAGSSFAADSPAFEDLDRNNDGKLSRSEVSTVKEIDFAKADTNKDGMLDRAEYEAAIG